MKPMGGMGPKGPEESKAPSAAPKRASGGPRARGGGGPSPQRAFADLDIAVVTQRDGGGELLVRGLQRTRARVRHVWPAPERIPTGFDVVFCDLLDDLPQRLPWLPGEPEAALIVILAAGQPLDLGLLRNCAAHAVVQQPATDQAVLASLLVGHSHFLYERRLRGRIEKLDENLRTMRSVERAKAILMKTRKISEEEAYHYLRRQAMERRVTIGMLANVVVDSQDLLG